MFRFAPLLVATVIAFGRLRSVLVGPSDATRDPNRLSSTARCLRHLEPSICLRNRHRSPMPKRPCCSRKSSSTGGPSRQVQAFNAVWDQRDAAQRFRSLVGRARWAGQLYALCALTMLEPAEAERAAQRLWFFRDTDDGEPTECPVWGMALETDVKWGIGRCAVCPVQV